MVEFLGLGDWDQASSYWEKCEFSNLSDGFHFLAASLVIMRALPSISKKITPIKLGVVNYLCVGNLAIDVDHFVLHFIFGGKDTASHTRYFKIHKNVIFLFFS